jgi:hypothetical protein
LHFFALYQDFVDSQQPKCDFFQWNQRLRAILQTLPREIFFANEALSKATESRA